ncbi:MAG TPA: sialidase family protein [Streptosporangiales bacterium]
MRSPRVVCVTVAALALALVPTPAFAQNGDTRVMNGSPAAPFSQNKQNEPAVAVDATHPNVVVAGANDNIDMEACNAGDDNTCPFTPGVGVSGVSFSFDSGHTWHQPTYTGLSARACLGVPGPDPGCQPTVGPIGTLPKYYENGLVSDGDPAVAFGPVYRNGRFDWANGTRLYYANLTSNVPGRQAFKGFEAIAVSRLDAPASTGLTPAIVDDQANWQAPVIVSKQNSALFSDKEQVWADNAASSPFFGHAYICNAAFRGVPGRSQPLMVATSTDGGSTWTNRQVTPAVNNPVSPQGFGRSGCTVRTDSHGVVYVFVYQFGSGTPGTGFHVLVTSHDGGRTWDRPRRLFPAVDLCNVVEPSIGRCVMDGIGGARDDLGPAPSVDIANGAPTGADATDQIIDAWADGRDGLNHEHVFVSTSTDRGGTWTAPRSVESPGDRGYYAAPAFSPNGTDAWLVYNAFTTPYRNDSTSPRALVGVVKHADVSGGGALGAFTTVHRGAPGDPRGSSQNDLAAEFLGDYVYAAATRSYGVTVWNDVRDAADCPAVDAYRQALHDEAVATGEQTAEAEEPRGTEEALHGSQPVQEPDAVAPDVQLVCPATFGNSDIFGGSYPDPTP